VNFIITNLKEFAAVCLSFQANTSPGVGQLTGNVLSITGTELQSTGRQHCMW